MNIVSIDGASGIQNDFSMGLTEYSGLSWDVYSLVSNFKKKSKWIELKRYLRYVQAGWHLFRKRRHINNIVAWQQFHGIFFAFFCHLFRVSKKTNLIILTFIYKKKSGIIGRLYEEFVKYALCDKYVDHVVCFSETEIVSYCEVFDLPRKKYSYVKVAANPVKGIDNRFSEPKFLFSAGFSHRDFIFLINSIKNTRYQLVIADDRVEDPHLPNIIIKRNCYGEDMLRELGRSFVFINPLKDRTISAGHLMTISAMQLHKPTISTISDGMKPYLVDGKTGFFVKKTRKDLLEKLDLLFSDEQLYQNMCEASYKYAENQFSWRRLAKDVCRIAKDNNIF